MKIYREAGLTLVELLIGIAIASFVMVILSYLTMSTSNTTVQTATRNNLIKEGQIGEQIISGHLAEAIYIWPSGITPNIILATTGITTKNTIDPNVAGAASYQWRFGNNGTLEYFDTSQGPNTPFKKPFVAMVLPPLNPTYDANTGAVTNCTSQTATDSDTTSTDTNASSTTDGCYRFFAYFPMRRSYLTAQPDSALAPSNKPQPDSVNDIPGDSNLLQDRWVIMEYRANLFNGTTPWTPTYNGVANSGGVTTNVPKNGIPQSAIGWSAIYPYLSGRSANVLIDYVKPGSVAFQVYRPGSPDSSGNLDPRVADSTGNSVLNANNGHVDYTFQLEKIVGKNKIQAASNNLGGSIIIKNWYCPKAMTTNPFAVNCP